MLIFRLIPKESDIFILDDILFAPINGLIFVAKKINDVVEKETSDEGTVKERLMALQLRFELDEIDEEEYDRQEDELLKKLGQIRSDKEGR
ncbi:MAG: gas vesicle protein GvpG [Chlorobiaceae bacterium]